MTLHLVNKNFTSGLALAAVIFALGCSVNVKDSNDASENHNVDIQTPVGGIHVSEAPNASDVGLPVYPGAKPREKDSSGENKSANVNISVLGYGVRVLALQYVSTDPQQKVVDFYKDQLKKYGTVLQCQTDKHSDKVEVNDQGNDKDENTPVSCEQGNRGETVELKVGVRSNQHVVAVERDGSGSKFALVYVRTHGKEGSI
jgi:hypothetical protein